MAARAPLERSNPWAEVELWAHSNPVPPHLVSARTKLRVKAELLSAENRARELLGLPPVAPATPAHPVHRVHRRGHIRRVLGRCAACQCAADTYTPGCQNCKERHRNRMKAGNPYAAGALLPHHPCPLGAYAVASEQAA